MQTIHILTLFPNTFSSLYQVPLIKRAMEQGQLQIDLIDIKHFASGSFRHIDDSPYGGGAGMILRCEPVIQALRHVQIHTSKKLILSPDGTPLSQPKVKELSSQEDLILLCGHYEGIDARIEDYFDESISIGDYVLSGGELAAMVLVDALVRLLPGVIRQESTNEESFEDGLLEYPQYTKPLSFEGKEVPAVLRSGNHAAIASFRYAQALEKTKQRRPDLYAKFLDKHPTQ